MKKLITALDVKEQLAGGERELYIDDNTIVTPAARDAANEQGLKIIKGAAFKAENCCAPASGSACATGGNLQAIDPDLLAKLVRTVLDAMGGLLPQSLVKETDPTGLLLMKGGSIRMEPFSDGNGNHPGIGIKKLVDTKESKNMAAGFLAFEHAGLTRTLACDEFDYIIEGNLALAVNGKTYTGEAGDVFFIPAGTTATFSTPNKTKFFFVAYPAHRQKLGLASNQDENKL